jgi:hypothetical protein
MSYDPNEDPNLRTPPKPFRRSSSSWQIWAGIVLVLLVAGFGWSQWRSHPGTDQTTTSSTTAKPPAMAPATPAPAPATPAPAPAAPAQ